MAMCSVIFLLLLLVPAALISTLVAAEDDDKAALLAFKAAAVSGCSDEDPLASWNSSTGRYCSWEGVRCRGRHGRVVVLSLPSRGLTGVLSPAVGNLSSLRILNLTSNRFSGNIPASLGRLHRLRALNLSLNAFSGEIPVNLSSCTSLTILGLQTNQLQGRIPSELGNKLTRLTRLLLWQNNLIGAIPATLANLSSLGFLSLAYNQLEGTIPPEFGGIVGLHHLDLANNLLSGEPPRSLYNLSAMRALQIQGNMFHGDIPVDIGKFRNMHYLDFASNKFSGSIPASLCNLTTLTFFEFTDNRLTGYVPHTFGKMQALQSANLGINMLQADDSKGWEFITSLNNCSHLLRLDMASNAGLTGQLPSSVANLSTTVQIVLFHETGISGRIPSAIGNLVNLNEFSVASTFIDGVIPDSIGELANLNILRLYNTFLFGQIPLSIGNLSDLTLLDAHHSNLEGPIPASIGKLKNLLGLDLSVNLLTGSIPRDIFKLPVISIYLNLSYNSLSGYLPTEVGSLRNLNSLDLSRNRLSGEIPNSIGECTVLQEVRLDNNLFEGNIPQSLNNMKGLITLNLSINKLSGNIPEGLGTIRNLQQLYLAHNKLSGHIPTLLQNLTSLSKLDLSFNHLGGEVPKEGIFRNLSNFTITGNNELCGGVPQLRLPPCHTNSIEKNRKGRTKTITICLASFGTLLFLASIIILFRLIYNKKLRQKQKSPFLSPILDEQYDRVSYNTLANATNGFSEANLLGKGTFGKVYKCTFEDATAAVKVFNLEQSGSTRSFVTECEALRRVRHRCLIKIMTCCSSINHQNQEFKALVFEFMPNGSLNDWLHPKSDLPTTSNTLSLEQRLDIAVDIMDALDYLHNFCEPPIIHCDLKPSNILLAADMSARVGDFGISRILPDSANKTLHSSSSTIGIRGSIGYVAPEYGEGFSVSTLGDVYSLGILLLEMFIGRSPTDDMFQGSLDLHKFSENALPDKIREIADMTMWLHEDAYDNTIKNRIENCLVSVISLGVSCSEKQPRERTPVQDAAFEMHTIRDSYLKFPRSLMFENENSSNSAMICTNIGEAGLQARRWSVT